MELLDFQELEDAINRAFDRLVERFEDLQKEQIEAFRWEWFNPTKRKSGQVVSSPRDIVDTGRLRDSLQVSNIGNNHVRYEYQEKYSGLVHQGFNGLGKAGSPENYPARPWVTTACDENDLLEIFREYLAEELQ